MMNPLWTYEETGRRCAAARRRGDESLASQLMRWKERALRLETTEGAEKASMAFDAAYRQESGLEVK